MVNTSLQIAQDADAWEKMPVVAPVQVFDSTIRRVVQVKSTVPIKPRSGPTLSKNCELSRLPYKMGESILAAAQIVIDGGWVFYHVRKRNYGLPTEKEDCGWLSARSRNYVTTVLKE